MFVESVVLSVNVQLITVEFSARLLKYPQDRVLVIRNHVPMEVKTIEKSEILLLRYMCCGERRPLLQMSSRVRWSSLCHSRRRLSLSTESMQEQWTL